MARQPRASETALDTAAEDAAASQPVCGVIMPISATASHTEEHWRDVQLLVHRAIQAAGFTPRNVWDNTSTDRVSERIIGNIFDVPIAVADISDLNPNVMLELGLRLSSKKPTLVIINSGGTIPFDIRDFHAVFYPSDMNMLGMENFFKTLSKNLKEKYNASQQENYTPFLSSVIVDVASPQTREVGVNELLLSRMNEISQRLSRLESKPMSSRVPPAGKRFLSGKIEVFVPEENVDDFIIDALGDIDFDQVNKKKVRGNEVVLEIIYSGADNYSSVFDKATSLAVKYGGDTEVPF
jgi:hypothetical protein